MAPTASPPTAGPCSVEGDRRDDDRRHSGRRSLALPHRHSRNLDCRCRKHSQRKYAGARRAGPCSFCRREAKKAPAKKTPSKKTKTLELTLTVTGTADGEWRAELKQGSTYLARNLAVAAAAVSRAAKELHEDLSTPIDGLIEEARSQQAARVAALEAELEAARKVLADLD